jgi:hypothetical protein
MSWRRKFCCRKHIAEVKNALVVIKALPSSYKTPHVRQKKNLSSKTFTETNMPRRHLAFQKELPN